MSEDDDDPPPLFERTQDDVQRDIRNWRGPVLPPLGLDDGEVDT